jgi:WD40 repeat protein
MRAGSLSWADYMAEFDVFLSYASADLAEARALEGWLQTSPRNRSIWRDRRGILPGAPDYYPPILAAISASAAFLLLLSPRWLRSVVAEREFSDAQAAGKKLILVVHPAIPRDPTTPSGRERYSQLMSALQVSSLKTKLERPNWIWLLEDESAEPDYTAVEAALATDFAWAARHAIIDQRLQRWMAIQNESALLRGAELAELIADAFADAPGRKPALTEKQREFLLESQRHDTAERVRLEGLYWSSQARAAAFAARERGEAEPDLALLLAAEAGSVAPVPEARAALLSLLHRHARLTGGIYEHGSGRWVSGVAFSRDGRWLASVDREVAIGDDRGAHLLVHDAATGREWERIRSEGGLSAVAWGERWLAVASRGFIGWLRWDDFDEKFRGNTPTALRGDVIPNYLAFSPPRSGLPEEVLAWGTMWGHVGLIRVGDHKSWQGRLNDDSSNKALTGLGWLQDGRLITAESGRLLARAYPGLEVVHEISAPGEVSSLSCDGERWVAACRRQDQVGLLLGKELKEEVFLPSTSPDLSLIAACASRPNDQWIVTGSTASRSGAPAVMLCQGETVRDVLLQGEEEPVMSVGSDPVGRYVAAGEMGGRVWLWDRSRRSHLIRAVRPEISARCIAACSAGHIALVTQEGHIQRLRNNLNDLIADVVVPFMPNRLLFTDSGRLLSVLAEDGQITIIDADSKLHQLAWPKESAAPRAIAVASEAPIIAGQFSDGTIRVFRLNEWSLCPVCTIEIEALTLGLELDLAGQHVYAAVERLGFDLMSWRVDAPAEPPVHVAKMKGYQGPLVPIAFAGAEVIAIGDGFDLLFVPSGDAQRATRRVAHDEPVKHIAADPRLVASVACWFEDTRVDQIRLWCSDGQPLGPVTLPEQAADIALCTDSNFALVLGQSGALWLLTLRVEDWIQTSRRIAGRSLTAEEERRYGVDAWRAGPRSGYALPPSAPTLFSS